MASTEKSSHAVFAQALAAKAQAIGFGPSAVMSCTASQNANLDAWLVVDAQRASAVLDGLMSINVRLTSHVAVRSGERPPKPVRPGSDVASERIVCVAFAGSAHRSTGSAALPAREIHSARDVVEVLESIKADEREAVDPRQVLTDRLVSAVAELVGSVGDAVVVRALGAPDDLSCLASVIASDDAHSAISEHSKDPLAAALARGAARRQEILQAEGGTASAQELADVLQITRQGIDKRRLRNRLLAIPSGSGDWRYPWWQLAGHRVVPGLDKVLAAVRDLDPWTKLNFFLSEDARLDDRRPLDALRAGDVDAAVHAAEAYAGQGPM